MLSANLSFLAPARWAPRDRPPGLRTPAWPYPDDAAAFLPSFASCRVPSGASRTRNCAWATELLGRSERDVSGRLPLQQAELVEERAHRDQRIQRGRALEGKSRFAERWRGGLSGATAILPMGVSQLEKHPAQRGRMTYGGRFRLRCRAPAAAALGPGGRSSPIKSLARRGDTVAHAIGQRTQRLDGGRAIGRWCHLGNQLRQEKQRGRTPAQQARRMLESNLADA